MVGHGLKKLAASHNMRIDSGVAYGSLCGYAATLSEGAGYKQIQITTLFPDAQQQFQLNTELQGTDLLKEFRVQEITFAGNRINIVFLDNPGTMKKIENFIEYFFPLLEKYGATKYNICTECTCEITSGQWKLIDGAAFYFHEACAQKVQNSLTQTREIRKQENNDSYVTGFVGALLGAILGAIAWGLLWSFGYIASIIGFVIGWLAEKGYNLLHGKQAKGKIVILLLSVVIGVFLGTFLGETFSLVGMIRSGELYDVTYADIPWVISILLSDAEYLGAIIGDILMGLLFAALGIFSLVRRANREVSDTKIKDLP